MKPVEIKYQPEVSWLITKQTTAQAQAVQEHQPNGPDDELHNVNDDGLDDDDDNDHDDSDNDHDDSDDDDDDSDENDDDSDEDED